MTNWQVKATEVKAGDHYRSLGPGFIPRQVISVTRMCNCQARGRMLDDSGQPRHLPVIVAEAGFAHAIAAGDTTPTMREHWLEHSTVTLTDEPY